MGFRGSFQRSDIDVADVASLGRGPGASQAGTFGHEIAEQFEKQVNGQNYSTGHQAGIAVENQVTGFTRGQESGTSEPGGRLRIVVPYSRANSSVDVMLIVERNVVEVR